MLLKDSHLIDFRNDHVELTIELISTSTLDPAQFRTSLDDRLFEHHFELMTDAALLDPPELFAVSSIVSRSEVPAEIQSILTQIGFEKTDQGDRSKRQEGFFGKIIQNPKRRVRLAKWSLRYLRSCDLSQRLAKLEDELDTGLPLTNKSNGADVFQRTFERIFSYELGYPSIDALSRLESALEPILKRTPRTLILRANSVRYITAFLTEAIKHHAPLSQWEQPDSWDGRFFVQSNSELLVHFEPASKVVQYLTSSPKNRLSTYAKSVIRQSLTSNA